MQQLPPLNGLRLARIAAEESQGTTGALIGKSQSHYRKIECGMTALNVHDARTLAEHFGLTIEQLFEPTKGDDHGLVYEA